eukprot:jgi/Orpsp1_1/1190672/evm.model.d7180000080429.1
MKFTTTCLTLLAAASALSVPIKRAEKIDWVKLEKCSRDYSGKDCDAVLSKGSAVLHSCVSTIVSSCELTNPISINNYKKECKVWEKSKCKALANKTASEVFSECKPIPKNILEGEVAIVGVNIKTLINMILSEKEFQCSTDEAGNLCPFIAAFGGDDETYGDDITEEELAKIEAKMEKKAVEAINATCKSKSCTKALIGAQESIKQSYDTLTDVAERILAPEMNNMLRKRQLVLDPKLSEEQKFDEIIKYLKSEQCIAQHVGNTATSTSTST